MIHLDRNGDNVRTWAGYVTAHRNHVTDTLIVVIDDRSATWSVDSTFVDSDGKRQPWWTVCDTHGTLIQHQTRALATAHAAHPEGWCEGCMELIAEWGDDEKEAIR